MMSPTRFSFSCPFRALALGMAAVATILVSSPAPAATSSIVGFYNVQVPTGNSAWVCGLVDADLYQGAAATVTADVDGKALVTFTTPGWTGGEFTLHYAEPQSGICTGLAIDILSNTTDTLKLNTTPAAAGLSNGMVFIVRKHCTLAGLLPNGGGFQPFGDSIKLIGANGAQSNYFWNNIGGYWIDELINNASNTIIRPGQGMIIQVGSPITVTIGTGAVSYVKTNATKIAALPNTPNLIGALNPLGTTTTLGALGVTTSMEEFNDTLITLAAGSLAQQETYFRFGANLINTLAQPSDNVSLPAGASVVLNVNTGKNIPLAPVTVTP